MSGVERWAKVTFKWGNYLKGIEGLPFLMGGEVRSCGGRYTEGKRLNNLTTRIQELVAVVGPRRSRLLCYYMIVDHILASSSCIHYTYYVYELTHLFAVESVFVKVNMGPIILWDILGTILSAAH